MANKVMCSGDPAHLVGVAEVGTDCPHCGEPVVEQTVANILIANIKRTALQEAPRPGGTDESVKVTVALCPGCGAPVWQNTNPEGGKKAKNEVVIDMMAQRKGVLCKSCQAIQYRYPELFAWVSNTHDWRNNRDEILEKFQADAMEAMRVPDGPPGPLPKPPQTGSKKKTSKKKKNNKKKT